MAIGERLTIGHESAKETVMEDNGRNVTGICPDVGAGGRRLPVIRPGTCDDVMLGKESIMAREDGHGPHEARPCTRKRDNERILIVSLRGGNLRTFEDMCWLRDVFEIDVRRLWPLFTTLCALD